MRFFTSTGYPPGSVLRGNGSPDDVAWVQGEWRPTRAILAHMFGDDDRLEEITEEQARAVAPKAFG